MSFDALHPAVQHHIVNSLGWPRLRPLQERSIEPVLAGDSALLIAPTAGGKTEAAVLPVLSRMLSRRAAFGRFVATLLSPQTRGRAFAPSLSTSPVRRASPGHAADGWLARPSICRKDRTPGLRRLGLQGTSMAQAQCTTIRLNVLKIVARLRITVRRIWLSFSETYPWASDFARILANLQRHPLRAPPV